MGCSQSSGDCCCCPNGQFFQEQICGNFHLVSGGATTDLVPFNALPGEFIEATIEVFNSVQSTTSPTFIVVNSPGGSNSTPPTIPPGNSGVFTAFRPMFFQIQGPPNNTVSGKFRITLYKQLLA